MRFEYSKLLWRIKEKYGSQSKFARAIELSERSLSQKINGKTGWKQQEIVRACEVLEIDKTEIPEYFFRLNVQEFEQSKSA